VQFHWSLSMYWLQSEKTDNLHVSTRVCACKSCRVEWSARSHLSCWAVRNFPSLWNVRLLVEINVSWSVTPFTLVDRYQPFWGIFLHLQGRGGELHITLLFVLYLHSCFTLPIFVLLDLSVLFFSLLILKKIKVGLWDHCAFCLSIYVSSP
jgi:hypothetical protein